MNKLVGAAMVISAVVVCAAHARDQIRIVGSSTVFPFSVTVAERFGAKTGFPTPIVESNGTGGGLALFCDGVGPQTPDIANASRRIKASELRQCAANSVGQITEIPIGYDGIVIANAKDAPDYALTKRQIFLALAKYVPVSDTDCTLIDNPNGYWSDVDPSLPDVAIEVFGPPPTSGTRDAFVEIAMEAGARSFACLDGLYGQDMAAFRDVAHRLREDGAWIDAGENDIAVINTLELTPTALGVAGFSFLDQNPDRVKGARIEGTDPTFETIAAGRYAISRSLYVYLKRAHVVAIPGLHDFALELVSDESAGQYGYLIDRGLIPLTNDRLGEVIDMVAGLEPMDVNEILAQ